MKIFTPIIILLLLQTHANAQQKTNLLFAEFGGSSIYNAIVFEKKLPKLNQVSVAVGVGIYGTKPTRFNIPFGVNYTLLHKKLPRTSLAIGMHANYLKADIYPWVCYKRIAGYTNNDTWHYIPKLSIRQTLKHNIMLQASSVIIINSNGEFFNIGIGIGKYF
jgi:hypothetical protein